MNDFINKSELFRRLSNVSGDEFTRMKIIGIIDSVPVADAIPVVNGHWIVTKEERSMGIINIINCSVCGNKHIKSSFLGNPKFCDECGAKMDEVSE